MFVENLIHMFVRCFVFVQNLIHQAATEVLLRETRTIHPAN